MPNGLPPPGLETETDAELNAVSRPALEAAMVDLQARRGRAAGPGTLHSDPPPAASLNVQWKWLQERNPLYTHDYWQECRALYAGGQRLLGDPRVMKRVFPSNLYEAPDVHAERVKRAHYYPYAGSIIDFLLAGLGTAPLRVQFGERDEKTGAYKGDEWWESFTADVTHEAEMYGDSEDDERDPDDEGGCTMHHFAVDVLREAMQCGVAWVLCDLPRAEEGDETAPRGDDPYLCLIPAEGVVEWEESGGKLEWVLTHEACQKRAGLAAKRKIWTHTYTLWTDVDWVRYVVEVDPEHPISESAIIEPQDQGDHPFGRVPFERLALPEGLCAMGKLHNLAREHFNKRCAQSWAEYKSLYAVLYEFQGPEDKGALPTPGAQQDPERGINQIRAQGYSQIRGGDDDARFIGPDVAPFKEARESCNDTMREMHRVLYAMALSANMDNKALQRSGESKEKDEAATQVLLEAYGRILRKLVRKLLALAAKGKGQKLPPATLAGLDSFDVQGVAAAITQTVELFAGVPILSQTFKQMYLTDLYVKILGDGLTQQQVEEIRSEVEEAGTAEQALMEQGLIPGMGGALSAPPPQDLPGEEDDEDDAGDEDDPIGKAGKKPAGRGRAPARRTMVASRPAGKR
jgi:hypothetical protein